MFVKLGEATFINVEDTDAVVGDPNFNTSHNSKILSKFAQFTKNLKRIAPKANDFLYFSAVMMHAAESVALNDDGSLKVLANGEPVSVGWEKKGDSWKWKSNDTKLLPYRNSNRDIFPEQELLTAHKKWVGKPLCIDHKSSSVDHVRGFIVDTYYDHKLKRVIALCALDKKNYPDLAHKVSSGYSNNVSMGTAVGQAICSDCGKVAKAEPDFCGHMRAKSCYGEINVDLSPIELSIVVNGADPKAKIKHIIAAANNLSNYVAKKESELKKIAADYNFSGSLSLSRTDEDNPDASHFNVSNKGSFEQFKNALTSALSELEEKYNHLKADEQSLGEEKNYAEDGGHMAFSGESGLGIAVPASPKFASSDDLLIEELKNLTASIEVKLANLKQDFNKLSTQLNQQEENMSGNTRMNKAAYYQGAGGVNEPTPGKPKYTADPLNEKMRTDGDKQMFVDDMGAIDELFPGDLDRKKLLARAEAEERALRRQAAVALAKEALENRKNAYFQGGGDVNEPTPGKVKYAPDPLAMKVRQLDKQMVGQKPFPEVGEVDGLHPSPESVKEKDELKRKEMLRRAGALKAQFVKAANEDGSFNAGDSRWNVYMGDKLVLTASVNEISGNKAELMYNSIATKDFGGKLIETVKTSGVQTVKSLFKGGQAAPAAAPVAAPAAAPAGMPGMPEMLAAPGGAPVVEEGVASKEGDPAEMAMELAVKIKDLSSDLVEALRALTGEKAEMGSLEGLTGAPGMEGTSAPGMEGTSAPAPGGKTASTELRTLANMRKELNSALTSSIKEAIAELKDHHDELEIISNMYDSGSVNSANAPFVSGLVSEAFSEAKKSVANTYKLMGAFVKYARGTEAMVKRAEAEAEMRKFAHDMEDDEDYFDILDEEGSSEAEPTLDRFEAEEEHHEGMRHHHKGEHGSLFDQTAEPEEELHSESSDELSEGSESSGESDLDMVDGHDADKNNVVETDDANKAAELGKQNVDVKLTSKAARAEYRAKLAADLMETSPMLDEAHPKGGFTTDLDVKAEGDLAHVEDLKEQHKAMMDVATASPKVRKEAEVIHRLVSEGKLDVNDLDSLVAEGLDAETAKYYRDYYGQVEGGKEFANELLKEAAAARAEEEKEVYRVKLARAYELAYEMVDRGLCLNDRDAVSAQVEEIMKFNDESFDSLKRVVARHKPVMQKQASVNVPQVGLIGGGDVYAQATNEDLYSQLVGAFSKSNRRMF